MQYSYILTATVVKTKADANVVATYTITDANALWYNWLCYCYLWYNQVPL